MSNHDLKSVIAEIMQASIDNFNKNEMYLLKHDVSERCICAKFACYVDKELRRRNLSEAKRLLKGYMTKILLWISSSTREEVTTATIMKI